MSRMYSVIAADGQAYGPADEPTLAGWAKEGRINAQSTLQDQQTGQRVAAGQVPSLAGALGLSPQMVNHLLQPQAYAQPAANPQQPQGYVQPQAYAQPAMVGYAGPYGAPAAPAGNWHQLTEFSTGLFLLLHFVTGGIFTLIHLGLMHDKMPKYRPDDPSAGKAIGFMFIPFFNLYWMFFFHLRLIDRINEQRAFAGMPAGNQKSLFIWMMCCAFGCIIPFLGLLALPAVLVLSIIYHVSVQGSVNELVQRTRATRGY